MMGERLIYILPKLVASFPNTLPYMSMDEITEGDDNGIGGGVMLYIFQHLYQKKE